MNDTQRVVPHHEVPSPWMTAEETAVYLRRKSRSSIYKLVHRNEIPFHKVGGLVLFHRAEIDAWVRNNKENGYKEIKAAPSRFQAVRQRIQSGSLKTESTATKPTKPLRVLKGGR